MATSSTKSKIPDRASGGSRSIRSSRGSPKGKKLSSSGALTSSQDQPSLLYFPIQYASSPAPDQYSAYLSPNGVTLSPGSARGMENSDETAANIVLTITFFIFLLLLIILLIGGICMWNTPCGSSDETSLYYSTNSGGSGGTSTKKAVRFADGKNEQDQQLRECPKELLHQILHGQAADQDAVILAFVAPWCGYCQQLKPTLREAGKRSKIPIFTLTHKNDNDADHVSKAARELDVKGFPMIFKIQDKKAVIYSGDRSLDSILEFANKQTN